jgi:hypothetical protein
LDHLATLWPYFQAEKMRSAGRHDFFPAEFGVFMVFYRLFASISGGNMVLILSYWKMGMHMNMTVAGLHSIFIKTARNASTDRFNNNGGKK